MQSERVQCDCCVRERINAQSTGQGLRPFQNVHPTDSMTETPRKAGAARRPLPDGDRSNNALVRSPPGISP
jgi:hypothetical protein